MLMLRRMTLRRKTDPKTGKHTWREPAQSKSTWTLHNSHFVWKFTRKCRTRLPRPVLCEPAQSKCAWTCQKKHLVRKFTKKMPDASPMASVLCEPAQSKCAWTCCILCGNLQGKCRTPFPRPAFCASLRSRNAHGHVKRAIWHFVRKFTRKMPDAYLAASVLCEPAQSTCTWPMSEEPFCLEISRKCRRRLPRPAFCASLRNRNAHGPCQKSHFVWKFQENAGGASRGQRFARACAIEMHMDNVTRGIFYAEIYKENAGRFSRGQRFVRACAVEMHMDMSQEPFCAEIYKENAGRFSHGQRFVRACAVEMHMDMSQEPILCGNLQAH